jgi:Golgi nucleoside diphosphatase
LRLLTSSQAEAIIEEVEQVLILSGFKLEKTLVEIMNPRDEGLYAWFTVNFLLDIFSESMIDSFVSLDLGGGSTQVQKKIQFIIIVKYKAEGIQFILFCSCSLKEEWCPTTSVWGGGALCVEMANFVQA